MAQNIYDDPTFFAGYSQLPGRCRARKALRNGALLKLCCLPCVTSALLISAAVLDGHHGGCARMVPRLLRVLTCQRK